MSIGTLAACHSIAAIYCHVFEICINSVMEESLHYFIFKTISLFAVYESVKCKREMNVAGGEKCY